MANKNHQQKEVLSSKINQVLNLLRKIDGMITVNQQMLMERTYAIKGDAFAANSFSQLTNRKVDYLIDLERQRIQVLCHTVNKLTAENRELRDENTRLRLQVEALLPTTSDISGSQGDDMPRWQGWDENAS